MTRRRRLHVNVGLQRFNRAPMWPSEPGYVAQMRRQSRELTDTLLDIFNQFEDASEDIMLEALEPTFDKALMYTPVLTGALKESGYLEKNPFRGKPRVEMGFARGGKPTYAVYVHEIPYNHAEPTRYKFLEQAMKEDLSDIYYRLGALYKAFMQGGTNG